jgi:ADP-heptose:LPS heptosyltransferase
MKKLLLRCFLSPGDIVMLTAAVRDLHKSYPGQFVTDVRTSCPELWRHNPYLSPLSERERGVEVIDCHYPLIDRCDRSPHHFVFGFTEFLNERLRLGIKPTAFKGDIHLANAEKTGPSQVSELAGEDIPFWILVAGGKWDFTIKWWDWRRFQEVVDHFRGKIQFVQLGQADHYHPLLEGVIDLRGKTDLRQVVRLMYHARGVLCPVTAVMHLAAAVETKPGLQRNRPCVVVAGGREPPHWESYPHHQFVHTVGALACCQTGGCWKSRSVPLNDGQEQDKPENLCVNVVDDLPRCMDMISAAEIIRRIELYFNGGSFLYLSPRQARAARQGMRLSVAAQTLC